MSTALIFSLSVETPRKSIQAQLGYQTGPLRERHIHCTHLSFASGLSPSETRYYPPNNLQVEGVKAATIRKVLQTMPMDFADILKTLRDVEPADLRTRAYPTREILSDAYCAVFRAGYSSERWTHHVGPSMEEWKAQYLDLTPPLTKDLPLSTNCTDNAVIFWCLKLLRGRTLFETQDGYIEIGPPRAQPGDAACVLLGCKAPTLLRPVSTEINSGFTVISECYIHVLNDGVTLLRPLPSNWRISLRKGPSGYAALPTLKNLRTNVVT